MALVGVEIGDAGVDKRAFKVGIDPLRPRRGARRLRRNGPHVGEVRGGKRAREAVDKLVGVTLGSLVGLGIQKLQSNVAEWNDVRRGMSAI